MPIPEEDFSENDELREWLNQIRILQEQRRVHEDPEEGLVSSSQPFGVTICRSSTDLNDNIEMLQPAGLHKNEAYERSTYSFQSVGEYSQV